MTKKADIKGFGSTVGYNAAPYCRLLGSLHVIEIFKKLAAENRGEILLKMVPPSVKFGSPTCGDVESCYFSSW